MSIKWCKQDEGLAHTSPRPFPSNEPNPETLEAIREGDAFFVAGRSGRFDNGADLIYAALKPPHSRPTNEWRLSLVRVKLALANTLNCTIEDLIWQTITLEYDS